MATRRGIAPRDVGVGAGGAAHAEARALRAEQTAWLALVPALVLAVGLIALLGPPLGGLLPNSSYTYWPSLRSQLHPKPTELARFARHLALLDRLALVEAVLVEQSRHTK
jgi:hypothetical protein